MDQAVITEMQAVITEMEDPKSGAKYQSIEPPNQPHTKVTIVGSGGLDTGCIAVADRGVQRHSDQFSSWVNDWVNGLESALERFRQDPTDPLATELLTAAAHEVKGGAAMANAPALTDLANPLCDLLERVKSAQPHLDLIELCVKAVDAARREKCFEADEKVENVVAALNAETHRRTARQTPPSKPAQAAGSAGV